MPTPALNYVISELRPVYWEPSPGASPAPSTKLYKFNVVSQVRPASVNHRRRSDNTRPPGNWEHAYVRGWLSGTIHWLDKSTGRTAVSRGSVVSQNPWPSLNVASADYLLQNARLKALAGATKDTAELSAALIQARQNVKMVTNLANRFARGLDKLMDGKRGLFRKLGRMSEWRSIPDEYLSFCYGWAPLGDDLAHGMNHLAEFKLRGFGYRMSLKSSLKGRRVYTRAMDAYMYGAYAKCVDVSFHAVDVARCGYTFNLPDWFMEQTPSTIAPFSTAYELMPWSFVIDWFVPIGNWIGALESARYSPFFSEGWELRYIRETATATVQDRSSSASWNPKSGTIDTRGFQRGAMSRRAVSVYPSSILTKPALNPFPGANQAAQGLSLLTQVFKRWQ